MRVLRRAPWSDAHLHLDSENVDPYIKALAQRGLPQLMYVAARFTPGEGVTIGRAELSKKLQGYGISSVYSITLEEYKENPSLLDEENIVGIRVNGMKGAIEPCELLTRAAKHLSDSGKHFELVGEFDNIKDIALKHRGVNLVIDHFAWPKLDDDLALYKESLSSFARSGGGKILFKGPGVRTHLSDQSKVQPFVQAILAEFGVNSLAIVATDYPHIGQEEVLSPETSLLFSIELARIIAQEHAKLSHTSINSALTGGNLLEFLNIEIARDRSTARL